MRRAFPDADRHKVGPQHKLHQFRRWRHPRIALTDAREESWVS